MIDHLALSVPDVDADLTRFRAAGLTLEDTTPEGPCELAALWDGGLHYVFLSGPEGARTLLCARRSSPSCPTLAQHPYRDRR